MIFTRFKNKINFFYLLHWKSKALIKFGYKKSLKSFRDDYGRYNHNLPSYSHIWLVNGTADIDNLIGRQRASAWLKNFVVRYETLTHQKLKEEILKLPKYREVYISDTTELAIKIVRKSLNDFGINTFQKYLSKIDVRIKNNFADFIK